MRENPLKSKAAPEIMKATPTYGFCPPKIPNANVWDKMTLFVPLKGLTRNSVNHRKIISRFHFKTFFSEKTHCTEWSLCNCRLANYLDPDFEKSPGYLGKKKSSSKC